jgi:hypothetical protein
MCFVFRHDLSDDVQLHCFRRWSKVKKEGSKEHSFAEDTPSEEASEGEEPGGLELPMLERNEYNLIYLEAESKPP